MRNIRKTVRFQSGTYEMGKKARPAIKRAAIGEALRDTLSRALKSGQPIKGGVTTLLYTEEADENARLSTDIRTDRMEVAQRMTDKWHNRENHKKMQGLEDAAAEIARGEGAQERNNAD